MLETIIISDRNIDTEFSGSTMSLCIILNGIIYVANIGNSRSVIGERDKSGKISAIQLTQDHVPGVEKESERIMSKGGRIFPVEYDFGPPGRPRIWLGHMDVPGLTISRSIGDTVGTSVGVVSSPDCTSYNINSGTKFLVIASDGVWDMVENQEVIDILSLNKKINHAMNIIVAESYSRWIEKEQVADNITICVLRFEQ